MCTCNNLRGRKCVMTNPMTALGREPEQAGSGVLKYHDSPLQQHERKEFTCERVQFIGKGQLGLLLLGWMGDTLGRRGVRTAGGPPGRSRDRLELAHGGAAQTTRTRPEEQSRRKESWWPEQHRSICSPCNESMGAIRSPPSLAMAEDSGADAPENKSRKNPREASPSGQEGLRPGRDAECKAERSADDDCRGTGAGGKGRVDSTAGGAVPAGAGAHGWERRPLRREAEGGAKDHEKRNSGRRGDRDRSMRAAAVPEAGTESPSV